MDTTELKYISTGDLADAIGYSVSGVKKLARLGVLTPAGTIAGRRIWLVEDVDRVKRDLASAGRSGRRPVIEAAT